MWWRERRAVGPLHGTGEELGIGTRACLDAIDVRTAQARLQYQPAVQPSFREVEDTWAERSGGAHLPSSVVLINVLTVPQGKEEVFLQMWIEGAHLMKNEPGFIDTKLHRSLAPEARFQFINIAHWESVEAWQAAFAKHEPNAMLIRVGIEATPTLYRVAVEY